MQSTIQIESDRPLPPLVARDAQLIGLLIFVAKTMNTVETALKADDAARTAEAVGSLMAYAIRTYGSGKNLEAQTLAFGKDLGFEIGQIDMRHAAHA